MKGYSQLTLTQRYEKSALHKAGYRPSYIAQMIGVYFAHSYCAWERGLNENANGLLRPYFPKGTNFKTLSSLLKSVRR